MKKLIKCNNECYSIASKILDSKLKNEYGLLGMGYLSLNFAFRMIHSLKALNKLLPHINSSGYYSSIALVVRPSLLDILSFGYVMENIENEDGLAKIPKEIIEALYIENLTRYIGEINLRKVSGSINHEKLVEIGNFINEKWGFLFSSFEVTSNMIKYKSHCLIDFPGPSKIYKALKSSRKSPSVNLANCYHNYTWCSKFEHFGILTVDLMRMSPEAFKEEIYRSNIYILKGIQSALYFIGDGKELIKKKIEQLKISYENKGFD